MKFKNWLAHRGVQEDSIRDLLVFLKYPGLLECPKRIMNPDSWFYFPNNNNRFILIGSCPNGDGIAIDTGKNSNAVVYINHEYAGDKETPIQCKFIQVASSLIDFAKQSQDTSFPSDFYEAKNTKAE